MSDPAPGGEVAAGAAPTPRSYFEDLYRRGDDPWEFATSAYEARKYAITLASLPDDRYRRAFEPGCSVGVLTEGLAARCDALLAVDHMDEAVAAARSRTARCPGVTVERRTIPAEWPEGSFDLMVLSEVAYYFDGDGLRRLMVLASASAGPGAVIVAVHWRGVTDYPLTGDQAHAIMAATPDLVEVVHHLEEAFVLDVWRYRVPDADRTGTGHHRSTPRSGWGRPAGRTTVVAGVDQHVTSQPAPGFQPTVAEQPLIDFVAGRHAGVLATIRRDGRPQLSNINYLYQPDGQRVRISVTADRAKTRNLVRDPRASLHVTSDDFWTWAVLSGDVTLSAAAADPGDDAVEELVELYRLLQGEHPDWDEYRHVMVSDRRQVVRIAVNEAYGQVPR